MTLLFTTTSGRSLEALVCINDRWYLTCRLFRSRQFVRRAHPRSHLWCPTTVHVSCLSVQNRKALSNASKLRDLNHLSTKDWACNKDNFLPDKTLRFRHLAPDRTISGRTSGWSAPTLIQTSCTTPLKHKRLTERWDKDTPLICNQGEKLKMRKRAVWRVVFAAWTFATQIATNEAGMKKRNNLNYFQWRKFIW